MQRIAFFFVALVALLAAAFAHSETVHNGLRFTYTGPAEFVYPFDGKQQSIRFNVTNTAATASAVYALRISVNGSASEYPGYAHFPNGANFSLAAGESSVVSSWAQGVYENLGPTAPPVVGESKEYTFGFVFTDASKPLAMLTAADSFTVSQKLTFTNLGDTPTLTGGLALGGTVRFAGATTLPNNAVVEVATPYSPRWYVATATAAPTTAAGAGLTVAQSLPARSDWLVRISAPGYASRIVALADITTATTATLDLTLEKRAAPTLAYKLAQQVATPTGFWRGAVSESEGTFVAIPGQENWKTGATDAETRSYREASRLYKYTFDGTKLWEHAPGWEIWGGDMTPDGKYVAYALNPTQTSFYQPTEYKLVLLDGATGTPLWTKTGLTSDTSPNSEARKLASLEVALSPDGKYVAVGSIGSGQVSVYDRATNAALWATSGALGASFGQVRNLKFSADSQFLYAGSGDNFLRKLRASDGTVLWKAMVGGWPFVNGLNFSPDGTIVTTGTKSFDTAGVRVSDGTVLWWKNTQFFDSVPSPDGAVTTSFNGVVYRLADGVISGMTKTHALSAYTPDGAYLLRMDADLALYDLTGVKLAAFDKSGLNAHAGEQPQWGYATKDGRYVIVLGRDMSTPGSTGIAIWERTSVAPVSTYALGVKTSGTGYGNVASSPAGIACYVPQPDVAYLVAPDCTENYASGTNVVLTATADAGSSFTGWSGSCSGTGSSCTVNMGEAKSATATFTLNVSAPVCTLSANPATITAGSSATLTAACNPAATSYVWSGGSCAGTTGASCTVTPTATTTYTVTGANAGGTRDAASATVTVDACAYTLGADSALLGVAASTGGVNVTTSCTWTATSNASWISITSGASGSGNGTVAYSVAANTGTAARTGTLTIAGKTFTLVQDGSPVDPSTPQCSLSASPVTLNAGETAVLSASCTPAATSYTWTGTGCTGASTSICTVNPSSTSTYTLKGSNTAGTGPVASVTVYVCNAPPAVDVPGVVLTGNASNEQFSSSMGSDTIDGADGVNTVVYHCNRANFSVVASTTGWVVSSVAEGFDKLSNVQRLQFADQTLALDISGRAGQAYRLYQAAFNRTPDAGGLKYWIDQMDKGMDLQDVAARFVDSNEFRSLYGANPTNASFLTRLYNNALHRQPDQGGYDWWLGELNSGRRTQTKALVDFSESDENKAGVLPSIQSGIALPN